MKAAGFDSISPKQLIELRVQGVTPSYAKTVKQQYPAATVGELVQRRTFHIDDAFLAAAKRHIHSLNALGYPTPDAGKLIAMRVHRVDPEEVKQVRALGYQPTLDELIQMRIFKITPDFIHRMQARGLNNLTISKLVQIRIFNLAD
jgi:hypothetical protein